jgi:hypothetical protein
MNSQPAPADLDENRAAAPDGPCDVTALTSHRPQPPSGTPAADLTLAIQDAITGLSGLTAGSPRQAAAVLSQTCWDLARAAAMARALPARPPAVPGYTFAAANAVRTAMRREDDLSRWLATVLASIDPGFACILAVATSNDLVAGGYSGGPVTTPPSPSPLASRPHIKPIPGLAGPPSPPARAASRPGNAGDTGQPAALPPPPGRPRSCAPLQAMDDAVNFRRARLAIHCPDCHLGARCDDHDADLALIETYEQMRERVIATYAT